MNKEGKYIICNCLIDSFVLDFNVNIPSSRTLLAQRPSMYKLITLLGTSLNYSIWSFSSYTNFKCNILTSPINTT